MATLPVRSDLLSDSVFIALVVAVDDAGMAGGNDLALDEVCPNEFLRAAMLSRESFALVAESLEDCRCDTAEVLSESVDVLFDVAPDFDLVAAADAGGFSYCEVAGVAAICFTWGSASVVNAVCPVGNTGLSE